MATGELIWQPQIQGMSLYCQENGAGFFGNAVNYTVGSSPSDLAVADFNSDGRPDLVVSNSASNNFSLLLNTGRCP